MIDLHAVYMETERGRWNATIHNHPYILVKDVEDLDTAKVLLRLYAAEELGAKYAPKRIDWNIETETINYRARGKQWTSETDSMYYYYS